MKKTWIRHLSHVDKSSKEINQTESHKGAYENRDKASNSSLEIARKAGWDDSITKLPNKGNTAIALEDAELITAGKRPGFSPTAYSVKCAGGGW